MSPDIAWYRLHGSGDRRLYLLIQSCHLLLLILKCVLFNFIAMCPSDKQRPRLYAFEDEAAAQPPTAEPARGPVDQALFLMLDNPTDRAVFQLVFITVHAAQ